MVVPLKLEPHKWIWAFLAASIKCGKVITMEYDDLIQ